MTKKTAFLFFVVLILFAFPLTAAETGTHIQELDVTQAQAAPTPTPIPADNIVSANVWPYLAGFFNLGYERKIFDMLSVRIRGLYWSLFSTITSGTSNFLGAGLDVYFYPQGKACKGWYLGPRADLLYIGNTSGNLQIYTVGFQAGHRWVFDGGFSTALALGGIANVGSKYTTGYSGTSMGNIFSGFLPTFDFDLGFAF